MARNVTRVLALLALAGTLTWLVASKTSGDSKASKKKKKKGSQTVRVTTHEVGRRDLFDTIGTVGTLQPEESLAIQNEVPGKIVRIGFEEGERVERGELLLQMRASTLRAELTTQQRRKSLLETELERTRRIHEKGGATERELDVARNEVEVMEAQIERTRAEIAKTTVQAPFAGRIGSREVSPGAVLTTGTTVAHLEKTDTLELVFSVPERFAPAVEEGTDVWFSTHGSDEIRRTEVSMIEPSLDPGNRTLEARARLDNADGTFQPGAYARTRLVVEQLEGVLTVPTSSILTSATGQEVWVIEEGSAKKQTVETGLRTESQVVVEEGLEAGDVVATTGRQNLSEGADIEVDTSEDAMDVSEIGPDPDDSGMTNQWLSEETVLRALRRDRAPDESAPPGDGDDEGGDRDGTDADSSDAGGSP